MSRCAAQPGVGDLRAGQLDVHAGRQCVLRDAVVQLAGDAVALGVEHLALAGRAQLGLGGLQLGVALGQVVGLAGGRGRAAAPSGRAGRSSAAPRRSGRRGCEHRAVGVVDLPARRGPRDEPADDPPVEPHRHVHVPPVRLARRAPPSSSAAPRTTASRCSRTRSGTARTSVHSAPSGPSTRWRGRDSTSSPSARAKTTQSADRCSAAASTTARTSASEPSVVRISAAEIRSSAAITRRSRSAEVRCSGK